MITVFSEEHLPAQRQDGTVRRAAGAAPRVPGARRDRARARSARSGLGEVDGARALRPARPSSRFTTPSSSSSCRAPGPIGQPPATWARRSRTAGRRAAWRSAARAASPDKLGYYAMAGETSISAGHLGGRAAAADVAVTARAAMSRTRRAGRVRAVPAARAPRGARPVRRLLLPEQCRHRRAVPARPGRRARRHPRRRLPPRQRHPGHLLRPRRRAVRLAARRSGARRSPISPATPTRPGRAPGPAAT